MARTVVKLGHRHTDVRWLHTRLWICTCWRTPGNEKINRWAKVQRVNRQL